MDGLISQASPMAVSYFPLEFRMHRKRRYVEEEDESSEEEINRFSRRPAKSSRKDSENRHELCEQKAGLRQEQIDDVGEVEMSQQSSHQVANESEDLTFSENSPVNRRISTEDPIEADDAEDDNLDILMELWQNHKISRQMRIEASKRSWVYRGPATRTPGVCCRCGMSRAFMKRRTAEQGSEENRLQCDGCGHAKCTMCILNRSSRPKDPDGKSQKEEKLISRHNEQD